MYDNDEEILKILPIIIKKYREKSNVRKLSKKIGVCPATLSRVENGKPPNVYTYIKLKKWLKAEIEYDNVNG